MKKQILNLGKRLTKSEQKNIEGGFGGGFGSGCWLSVEYEDGGQATVPYEGNQMLDPFGVMACNAHAQQVAPRLVSNCFLDCSHL